MTATPAARSSEIRALTGLRGIAALFVVLYHATGYFRFPDPWQHYIRHGYISVDLFFVLSGFVMAMTYGKLFDAGFQWPNFRKFILMRVARVWPLFALMTLITAALIPTLLGTRYYFEDVWHGLLPNLTMTQAWGLANSIVRPSWSISTEWAAYLVFPLLVIGALKGSWQRALICVAVAAGLLALVAYGPLWFGQTARRSGPLDIAASYATGTMLRCLLSFFIGMVAYRFRALVPSRAALLCLVAALLLIAWRPSDLILVGLFAGLIMALSEDEGPVAKMLSWRPVYLAGVWSYAIYLIHDVVLFGVFRTLPKLGLALPGERVHWLWAGVALTVALSALAHYGFEKPSRDVLRRLVGRWTARKPELHALAGDLPLAPTTAGQPAPLAELPVSVAKSRR
ncbi:acyltransferase [Asticcacaulis sp. AND118]|uniref:acyltransferase family protein n=1 Tax=Asticcacaulis sp. AND118 TaxID=2840468 RepID=UPI001CFF9498|nr:acyltransferase [Asticcacaulis sp. AND118]UDF05400.1 acyltransferase [Asticcacaulis sp. AND118]